MGMPITIEIADEKAVSNDIEDVFNYFKEVDKRFSPFKPDSEVSRLNRGELLPDNYSNEMKDVLYLCDLTKNESFGYFDIKKANGNIDPSGVVKGWSVLNAATILKNRGYENYYIDAGGDIEIRGKNRNSELWKVGIRNPFNAEKKEVVKSVYLSNCGIATSGNYIRGNHIYDPKAFYREVDELLSITVIATNVCEADRFATAAFAMGNNGILFLEKINGLEGYSINKNGIATMTSGFEKFTHQYEADKQIS